MYKGIILLLTAELCFTVATVLAKLLTNSSAIPPLEITFFRFFVGAITVTVYIYVKKISVKPNNISLILWRTILNMVAVMFFFMAAKHTSITNTNMLNMTYPVFIFILSPLFFKEEKLKPFFLIFLMFTMCGIWLVVNPDFNRINIGDVYGLTSGVIAAFGIITLRMSREHDSTELILFYLMGLGSIINGIVMIPVFQLPLGFDWVLLLSSALAGVVGQVFITSGYRHISARAGSLISGSRIIYAVILGIIVFSEDLTIRVACGGLLILVSIIAVGLKQK